VACALFREGVGINDLVVDPDVVYAVDNLGWYSGDGATGLTQFALPLPGGYHHVVLDRSAARLVACSPADPMTLDLDSGVATELDLGLGVLTGFAADATGNLYAVGEDSAIYRWDGSGVTRVAGTPWHSGYGGDGGPAIDALISAGSRSAFIPGLGGMSIDADGALWLADTLNQVVRKVAVPLCLRHR
jgi:hypothetical protein